MLCLPSLTTKNPKEILRHEGFQPAVGESAELLLVFVDKLHSGDSVVAWFLRNDPASIKELTLKGKVVCDFDHGGVMKKLGGKSSPDFIKSISAPDGSVGDRQIHAGAFRNEEADADDMAFLRVKRGFFFVSMFFIRCGLEVKGYNGKGGKIALKFLYRENGFVIHR